MNELLNSPVLVTLVAGLLTIIGTAVVEILRRQHKAIAAIGTDVTSAGVDASMAREQTQNNHSTNLRDDLDQVINGVKALLEGQSQHRIDINTLRYDLSLERTERITLGDRVDDIAHHQKT